METSKEILETLYTPRSAESKKYDHGLVTVIGGSELYSGAPALSALAAFRAGCDMVRVIAPKRAADIIASFSPILAAYPLKGDWLLKEHLATLLSLVESANEVSSGKTAVVIGGGAGRSEETQEIIAQFLAQANIPVVIDADAIYAIARNSEIIAKKPFLITPHSYEFFVLTGKEIAGLPEDKKIELVRAEAQRLQTTILLKGAVDIISDGSSVSINRTGSPLMAKGGTGDTLAGIAGALLARGISPLVAGAGAAFINGFAGELAIERLGESFVATDLIEEIYEVLKIGK